MQIVSLTKPLSVKLALWLIWLPLLLLLVALLMRIVPDLFTDDWHSKYLLHRLFRYSVAFTALMVILAPQLLFAIKIHVGRSWARDGLSILLFLGMAITLPMFNYNNIINITKFVLLASYFDILPACIIYCLYRKESSAWFDAMTTAKSTTELRPHFQISFPEIAA